MPAVTVDDLSVLPKVPAPVAAGGTVPRARPVVQVETAAHGLEGEGFPVRRAFTGVDLADLDPFVHLDQIGEIDYGPGEPKGTPWHPHRGFETVTYMMDGVLRHEDSTGGGGVIRDGGTQWMTAGKGILHIETPPEDVVAAGGVFHGLQLWVNLASKDKWLDPRYQDLTPDAVALLSSDDGGALVRLIAGDLGDVRGPGTTHSPMSMIHATIAPGARLVLPWPQDFNALVYVLAGNALVGAEQRPLETGQIAVHGPGDLLQVDAAQQQARAGHPLELLVLGGRPLREPVAWMGPFVMNTKAEIAQAFDDFEAGKLGQIPPEYETPDADLEPTTDSPLD
ncbi:MAG: Pirin domain protein [Actinomycetia bacterium]|nr:Pirin domain protein [Actinomycetes bacterium]